MKLTWSSDSSNFRRADLIRQRALAMWPATRRAGEQLARLARRKAPRGRSRRQASLQASIGHAEPEHNVTVITSNKPYAKVQAFGTAYLPGGAIRAGTGKLGARLLAIPINDAARRILDGLGANQSLREVEGLLFLKTRKGRMVLIRQVQPMRGKRGKSVRGRKREHRFLSGQVLFILTPTARPGPSPKPDGYIPKLSDPEVRVILSENARKWIAEGRV